MTRVPVVACALALVGELFCGANAPGQEGTIAPPARAFRNGKRYQFMKSLDEVEPRVKIKALPYDIVSAGSYYVTGNLTGEVSRVGITVHTTDVDLDLNGFSLIGNPGSRSGIYILPNCVNVRIRNGVVRGWGQFGIDSACKRLTARNSVKRISAPSSVLNALISVKPLFASVRPVSLPTTVTKSRWCVSSDR